MQLQCTISHQDGTATPPSKSPVFSSLQSCEPSVGPEEGGTLVRLHGEGFAEGLGFGGGVMFGHTLVPCWRESEQVTI